MPMFPTPRKSPFRMFVEEHWKRVLAWTLLMVISFGTIMLGGYLAYSLEYKIIGKALIFLGIMPPAGAAAMLIFGLFHWIFENL